MSKCIPLPYTAQECSATMLTAVEAAPLGIPAKSLTPPQAFVAVSAAKESLKYPENEVGTRLERFALQSQARDLLPKTRTGACLRNRIKGATHVAVKYSKIRARASYGNLQTCGSVWACPVCAAKVSEHRRTELTRLVAAHRAAGGMVVLVTRTFPHTSRQSLAGLLSQLAKAEDKYRQGEPWKRLKNRFGIVGTVRAIECTFGANGWHPHIHELVFLNPSHSPSSSDPDACARKREELEEAFYTRWLSAATRAGFPPPSRQHGVDVSGGEYAAAYAAKWGIESELTKWHIKRGRSTSMTPFDLLRIALHSDDRQAVRFAGQLFTEYAEAFKGKRQLVYSPGLRAMHGLQDELSDEEAAEGEDPGAELLGLLEPAQWRAICKANLRGELLEAVNESGGQFDAIAEVLALAWQRFETVYPPGVSPVKAATNRVNTDGIHQ